MLRKKLIDLDRTSWMCVYTMDPRTLRSSAEYWTV
jgi:hypothetical protein